MGPWAVFFPSLILRACLFQLFSWLFQLKSKRLKQTAKKKADFWNIKKQAFEEMN
jgi:hypothetical protein